MTKNQTIPHIFRTLDSSLKSCNYKYVRTLRGDLSRPFGMQMHNRAATTEGKAYRFGFNGMERDDETKGEGNSYTSEYRQYDPRLGRFLSIDPKSASFQGISPYNSMLNSPIVMLDPRGDSTVFTDNNGNVLLRTHDNLDNSVVVIAEDMVESFNSMVNEVRSYEEANALNSNEIIDQDETVSMLVDYGSVQYQLSEIDAFWDMYSKKYVSHTGVADVGYGGDWTKADGSGETAYNEVAAAFVVDKNSGPTIGVRQARLMYQQESWVQEGSADGVLPVVASNRIANIIEIGDVHLHINEGRFQYKKNGHTPRYVEFTPEVPSSADYSQWKTDFELRTSKDYNFIRTPHSLIMFRYGCFLRFDNTNRFERDE